MLDGRDPKSKAGHIGLQYNKDKKIEFRNIKLKPLGLKPIFNGKDLSGWRVVEPPKPPKETAEWTVQKGAIHVLHGGGQLETEGTWDDFVLQLDVRANSQDPKRHPNSGVFLRGDAEELLVRLRIADPQRVQGRRPHPARRLRHRRDLRPHRGAQGGAERQRVLHQDHRRARAAPGGVGRTATR